MALSFQEAEGCAVIWYVPLYRRECDLTSLLGTLSTKCSNNCYRYLVGYIVLYYHAPTDKP
jgi:hypothetical protein